MVGFPKLKIAQKLSLAMVACALLASAGVGLASYLIGSAIVLDMGKRQMQTVASSHADEFTTYLKTIEADLINIAATESTVTAARDFAIAWKNFAKATPALDPVTVLRDSFITNNPYPAGERQLLDKNDKGRTNYDTTHDKVQATLRRQLEAQGYRDLYMFDTAGNLIYSVMKNDDFAMSFAEGSDLGGTALGRVYQAALKLTERGQVAFEDRT